MADLQAGADHEERQAGARRDGMHLLHDPHLILNGPGHEPAAVGGDPGEVIQPERASLCGMHERRQAVGRDLVEGRWIGGAGRRARFPEREALAKAVSFKLEPRPCPAPRKHGMQHVAGLIWILNHEHHRGLREEGVRASMQQHRIERPIPQNRLQPSLRLFTEPVTHHGLQPHPQPVFEPAGEHAVKEPRIRNPRLVRQTAPHEAESQLIRRCHAPKSTLNARGKPVAPAPRKPPDAEPT